MKPSGIFVTGGRGGYKAVREGAGHKDSPYAPPPP